MDRSPTVSDRADSMAGRNPAGIETVEPEDPTVARFDPMLRALLTFGLVEPERPEAGGEGQGWRLIPAVQHRLRSLVTPAPPAEKLIYFGHRCGSCGEHGPTRNVSGVYLCDECRHQPVEELRPLNVLKGPRSA